MNLDRNSINPAFYDLKAVVQHEIDEVLGMGSGLNLPTNFPRLSRPQDLFRYSGNGVRSFVTGTLASDPYFSIDGGATSLANFHQAADGADYGDWGSGTSRVQNAFGTPGATPNLGVELTNLDVIGYDLISNNNPVPEPSTLAMFFVGASALIGYRGVRWTKRK